MMQALSHRRLLKGRHRQILKKAVVVEVYGATFSVVATREIAHRCR
jgi:hypothetical protein